jgi:hypothetical protein
VCHTQVNLPSCSLVRACTNSLLVCVRANVHANVSANVRANVHARIFPPLLVCLRASLSPQSPSRACPFSILSQPSSGASSLAPSYLVQRPRVCPYAREELTVPSTRRLDVVHKPRLTTGWSMTSSLRIMSTMNFLHSLR